MSQGVQKSEALVAASEFSLHIGFSTLFLLRSGSQNLPCKSLRMLLEISSPTDADHHSSMALAGQGHAPSNS